METSNFRRHALVPKVPLRQKRPAFVPILPDYDPALSTAFGKLTPDERRALRQIVETMDLLIVEGRPYLLAVVDSRTLDALAAFEAEEIENDLCDEEEEDLEVDGPADGYALNEDDEDGDPHGEGDGPENRVPFIEDRTHLVEHPVRRFDIPGWPVMRVDTERRLDDRHRDQNERRKAQRFADGADRQRRRRVRTAAE